MMKNNKKYFKERKVNQILRTSIGGNRAVLILHNFDDEERRLIQDFFWFEENKRQINENFET